MILLDGQTHRLKDYTDSNEEFVSKVKKIYESLFKLNYEPLIQPCETNFLQTSKYMDDFYS